MTLNLDPHPLARTPIHVVIPTQDSNWLQYRLEHNPTPDIELELGFRSNLYIISIRVLVMSQCSTLTSSRVGSISSQDRVLRQVGRRKSNLRS